MNRSELIDWLDDYYGDHWETFETLVEQLFGLDFNEDCPDDDPDEGFFANFTTSQLTQLKDAIENSDNMKGDYEITNLTKPEISLIRELVEMATNAAWVRSREKAVVAKYLLDKIDREY